MGRLAGKQGFDVHPPKVCSSMRQEIKKKYLENEIIVTDYVKINIKDLLKSNLKMKLKVEI